MSSGAFRGLFLSAAAFLASVAGPAAAQEVDPEATLDARCGGCHERTADGGLSRISQERKTPRAGT